MDNHPKPLPFMQVCNCGHDHHHGSMIHAHEIGRTIAGNNSATKTPTETLKGDARTKALQIAFEDFKL